LPHVPEWANPAWHLYVVRTSDRDRLQGHMTKSGIGTQIHYPIPPHMQKAYVDMKILPEAFPLARDLASEVLSLPLGPQLSLDQVQDIVNALKNA
jgi:dTDP-4-amino-4,6-dideoxygalactose transaminase